MSPKSVSGPERINLPFNTFVNKYGCISIQIVQWWQDQPWVIIIRHSNLFSTTSASQQWQKTVQTFFSGEITRVLRHMYKFIVGYILGGQKENLTQNTSKTYLIKCTLLPFHRLASEVYFSWEAAWSEWTWTGHKGLSSPVLHHLSQSIRV